MAEIDAETVERVARWCAEAGRRADAAEIRRALAPLSWDELLLAKALLADPPPARPLGPSALADIARGAPPDVAAERERGGRYAHEGDRPAAPEPVAIPASRPRARAASRPREPTVVIRRARDRIAPAPAAAPALPTVDELRRPEGRALLERLFRRLGARRAVVAAALAKGWRREDGAPLGERDLDPLLDHHGLSRAFERRERDEMLHALRASGGIRAAAAERLGLDPAGLDAALARLGASDAAERIREERRAELRRRATLAERVRLLLADEPRLRDLGLVAEWEEDLRRRLPEHVRALRAASDAIAPALAASLAVKVEDAVALATRFGLALGGGSVAPASPRAAPHRPRRPRPARQQNAGAPRPQRPARPQNAGAPRSQRPAPPRARSGRPGAAPRPARGRRRPPPRR